MKFSVEKNIPLGIVFILVFVVLIMMQFFRSISQSTESSKQMHIIVSLQRKIGDLQSIPVYRERLFEDIVLTAPSSPDFKSLVGKYTTGSYRMSSNLEFLEGHPELDAEISQLTSKIIELNDQLLQSEKTAILKLERGEKFAESQTLATIRVYNKKLLQLITELSERVSNFSNERTAQAITQANQNERFLLFFLIVMTVFVGFFILVTGLTLQERSRTEEALKVAKDYNDNIIQSMTELLIVMNLDGTIRTVNPAVITLLGFEEKELLGEPIGKIVAAAAEIMPFSGTGLEKLIAEGTVRDYELKFKTKDGEEIPVSVSGAVMHAQQIQGIVLVAKDMRQINALIVGIQESKKLAESKTYELLTKNARLEAFQKLVIGRELDMIALKKEVNALYRQQNKPIPYPETEEIEKNARFKSKNM